MKTALLVLDAQNDFFDDDNPNLPAFNRAVATINSAIALFREHGLPVVFAQDTSARKRAGTRAWEIYSRVDCRDGDVRICKANSNAFWRSELEAVLQQNGVRSILVAGFLAEYCVLSTLRGGSERGFETAILKEGIASLDDRRTEFVREISPGITLEELMIRLQR